MRQSWSSVPSFARKHALGAYGQPHPMLLKFLLPCTLQLVTPSCSVRGGQARRPDQPASLWSTVDSIKTTGSLLDCVLWLRLVATGTAVAQPRPHFGREWQATSPGTTESGCPHHRQPRQIPVPQRNCPSTQVGLVCSPSSRIFDSGAYVQTGAGHIQDSC